MDASVEQPIMKFFWPIRKTAELAETVEDPYDEKSGVKPKRKRVESISTSSDESDFSGFKCKRFGLALDSDASSESSGDDDDDDEGGGAKFVEITTIDPNDDEDDEFEVSFFPLNSKKIMRN